MAEWDDPYNYSLYAPSTDYSVPDFGFDFSFPGFDTLDFNVPDFDFSQYDFTLPSYEVPTFDPGQFDLGFDPTFDLGQYTAGISDPFSIPTGDLNLPNFDLTGYLAAQAPGSQDFFPSLGTMGSYDFGPEPTFNLGDTQFPDLGFELGEGGSPLDASMFGSNLGSLTGAPGPQVSSPEALFPDWGLSKRQMDTLGQPKPAAPGSPDALKDAQAGYYKWAPLLGLGQLGLGLSGGLMAAFNPPQPRKPSALENAKTQAEIDAIRAKIDLERQALAMRAEEAAAAAEGAGEDPREAIARMQNETAIKIQAMKAESDRLLAEMTRNRPLFESDPRFSTLYDETTGAQQALSPDNPEIQQMTQQIYSTRRAGAAQQYQEQRDAILERANRLGTNPAAELAQINEAEQQADSALLVEAQQTALAFAQSRLDPSQALLQAILKTVV
jgi:hypothetical protein